MPDSKITALTALTSADPAVDMFPVVDVSDTTMAASGTTKRISINNILACSPTATLASATISGDLTVDTSTLKVDSANNRVGIGTASPAQKLSLVGDTFVASSFNGAAYGDAAAERLRIGYKDGTPDTGLVPAQIVAQASVLQIATRDIANGTLTFHTGTGVAERYRIDGIGVSTWSISGSTAMTLNATGLGVGVVPNRKLHIGGTGNQVLRVETITSGDPSINLLASGINDCSIVYDRTNNYMRFDVSAVTGAMILGPTGNVGIGVTPSAWGGGRKAIQIASPANIVSANLTFEVGSNWWNDGTNYKYTATNPVSLYSASNGLHAWYNAPSGTAGNNITFTQAMTLDASGRLILLASTTTPATLATNGELTFTATSNTNLRFSYRGSDGVTRVANLTLA